MSPGYNPPNAHFLADRLGQSMSDVATLKKQGTEYVVNERQECVAIVGNIERYPLPAEPGVAPSTQQTGLSGWGVAVLNTLGGWESLGAQVERGGSLPASPYDGQEYDYIVSADKYIVWRLRYQSAIKQWNFVGGPPTWSGDFTRHQLKPGTNGPVKAPNAPSITVPRNGSYMVSLKVGFIQNNLPAYLGQITFYAGLSTSSLNGSLLVTHVTPSIVLEGKGVSSQYSMSGGEATGPWYGLSAGQIISVYYTCGAEGKTQEWIWETVTLTLLPVALS